MTPHTPLAAFGGYGIELEYMIVDAKSLDVLPIADILLDAMADEQGVAAKFGWSNELVLHLLELKNLRPSPGLDGLAQEFQAEIGRVGEVLKCFGARLMPGGMHPWMNPATDTRLWPHGDAEIYRAYDGIFDCRAHGWANIQSMQLNLPFSTDDEFARLHAAVRLLLPILPALAASSPVADGRVRDALDFRMECYRLHAALKPSLIGLVVPDNASTPADYRDSVLEPMYAEVAPFDPNGCLCQEWLNARGAIPRFDRQAMEIRVLDMQECPEADLAVAALVGAVVRSLYRERWSSVAEQQSPATEALAAILAGCVRDADRTMVEDPRYLSLFGFPRSRCEVHELWRHLFEACADDPLIRDDARATLDFILGKGPLARRILLALGENFGSGELASVYRDLCNCLSAGRLFGRPS